MDAQAGTVDEREFIQPLQKMFASRDIEVLEWSQQPLKFFGTTGVAVARYRGRARVDGVEQPWSLGRKKLLAPTPAPSDPSAAALLSSSYYWIREKLIYESGLLDDLPVGLAAARGWHIAEDPDGYALWAEDVRDELEEAWPLAFYATAAYHLGCLHGIYLAARPLPTYPWFARDIARQREKHVISREQLDALRQDAIMQRGWPEDVAAGIFHIWQEREHFFQARKHLPQVFQHGDFVRRNLFARMGKNGDPETVAIDWQFVGIGILGEDLTCLVCSAVLWFFVSNTQLRELEELAFAGYLRGLREMGWEGDEQWVRLGYAIEAATRYSMLPILEAPNFRQITRQAMPQTLEEIADNCAALRRYLMDQAGEARKLMAVLLQ